jgi:type I restriction enzyme S subunit
MKNWQPYRLGSFLKRHYDSVQIDDFKKYKRISIRTKGQGIDVRDEVVGVDIGTKNQFKVKTNQFLLSKIDAMNGAFGIVPGNCNEGIITGNFWAYDIDENIVLKEYLGLLCLKQVFTEFSLAASEGTTNRKYLREEKFLDLTINLPNKAEQQQIISKIEVAKSKLDEIKLLRAGQEKEISNLRFSIFEKLNNVYGTCQIGDLIAEKLDPVIVDPTKEYLFAGVYGFGKGLFVRGIQNGNNTTYKTFNTLYENQLVMSQPKGWEGAIALVSSEFEGLYLSPVYSTFAPRENNNIRFVAEFCKLPTTWQKMLDVSKGIGARRNSIYAKDFLKIKIPNVPIEEQNRIVELLEKINEIKINHKEQEQELTELMPSMLDKAFKGEL